MVESSEDGRGHELRRTQDVRRFIGNRRLTTESLVRSLGMIVAVDELAEQLLEMSLAERDDVIE